jgi:hypothetical protein
LLPAAPEASVRSCADRRNDLLKTATIAGLSTAVMGLIAPTAPPRVCGLVAAIPVIGMSTTVSVPRQGGAVAVVHFLRGYVQGLQAKVVFLAVLAWLLPQCAPGIAGAGVGLGAVAFTLSLSGTARTAIGPATRRLAPAR